MLRTLALTLLLAGSVVFATGCGSDDSSKDASADQIQAAKAEQKRIDAQNEKNRTLQRQVDELKNAQKKNAKSDGGTSTKSSGSSSSSSSSSGGASATPPGCSGGVTVNSSTSCGFAQNVRADYESSGGSGPVTTHTFSAATGIRYEMQCTGGSPHVCTGGNNAYLTFP